MKCFRFLWGNRKYRVFKILTKADGALARRYCNEARQALEKGDLERAEFKAATALMLRPGDSEAQDILKHVVSLKDQGFRYSGNE